MATLPVIEQRTRVSGAGDGPGPQSGHGSQALVQAAGEFGDALAVVQQRDAVNDTATALANLRQKSTQRLLDAQSTAQPDAVGFTDEVLKGFDSDVTAASAAVKSPITRKLIKQHAQELRAEQAQRAMVYEASTRADYRSKSFLDSADKLAATLQRDPSQWEQAGAEQMAGIDALGLPPAERLDLKRRVDGILTEGAALGRAKLAPARTLEALKGSDPMFDGLSVVQRNRIEQVARGELVDQKVAGVTAAFANDGPYAGVAALGKVQKDGSLPPDLLAEVQSRVNSQVTQLRTQRQEEHADEISAVVRAIASDTAGATTHTSVDALYQAGALSPEQRATMHGQIDASIVQGAAKNRGAIEIANALAQGLPLDPRDPDQKKALGAAFEVATVGQLSGSPGWQATAQAWTQQTRLMPEPAIAWTRAALRSPDPKLAANAAQFLGAVQAGAPDAVGEFDDDTKALGGTISSMIEAGTPTAQAVETARANVLDMSKETRERRLHAWKGSGNAAQINGQSAALNSFIDRDFDPGWFSSQPDPVAPGVARASGARVLSNDFDAQTERYFLKTGDITVARDLAWKDVTRVYGPSKVNGNFAMMAFPPERFGIKPEEIRTELGAFVTTNPQADESTAADLVLVPDSLTLRSVGDAMSGQAVRPSYAVVGKSGDQVLDNHGVPVRWTIPSGEELGRRFREAQAASATAAANQVAAARAERAQRLAKEREFAEMVRSGSASPAQD